MPEPDLSLGGAKTRLTATYSWGQQGLEAQFRDVYQPGQGIFSPGYPLAPLEPEQMRAWDFPVGVNTVYTPRAYEPVSFDELRRLADAHDITRLAIETRKDQLEKLDWTIRTRGGKAANAASAAGIAAVAEFWRRPDGERPRASATTRRATILASSPGRRRPAPAKSFSAIGAPRPRSTPSAFASRCRSVRSRP